MKTLRAIFLAWLACGLLVSGAAAFQDQSFQYAATAGMFEDMYDLFTDSPAYLSSFSKNAIWSQLSNLRSRNDYIFDYNPNDQLWQAGGTTDLIGPGRLGVMVDWHGYSTPVENYSYYDSTSHYGFGESEQRLYFDVNGDNIIETRQELYSRSEAQDNYSEGEIYAAYGLGLGGLDAGIGVRGSWSDNNPTHNPYPWFWMGDFAFDQLATYREVDISDPNNPRPTQNYDFSSSGSWNWGYSDWSLILAARSQDAFGFMPGLGLLVNVRPYLENTSNKLESQFEDAADYSPSDPNIISTYSSQYEESGFEEGYGAYPLPRSGFGVDATVRADYAYLGVNWTGWINVESSAYSLQNADYHAEANQNSQYLNTNSGIPVFTNDSYSYVEDHKNEGQGGFNWAEARLRAQLPFTGWRIGAGVNGIASGSDSKRTETITARQIQRHDEGDITQNYTTVYNAYQKRRTTTKSVDYYLQFPFAIVIDVLKNFSVQVGAQYNIHQYSDTETGEVLEGPVPSYVTTYDDGRQDFNLTSSTFSTLTGDWHAEQRSSAETNFSTDFSYGLTWKPWEQVQIDLTGFSVADEPWRYCASFTLYY
ncbi:MAG: hypothetical protein AB1439_05410 [candidate division FCPU426 bacterium]